MLGIIRRCFIILNEQDALDAAFNYEEEGRTIVFDLDNTLFPEDEFLNLAYAEFSRKISYQNSLEASQIHSYLIERLHANFRGSMIQDLSAKFKIPFEHCEKLFFHCLRGSFIDKNIELFDWASTFIEKSSKLHNCAIITNGNVRQQSKKINLLWQLRKFRSDRIIFANAYAPKPSPISAKVLENSMRCHSPVYFGDDVIDGEFAEAAGWAFFKVEFYRTRSDTGFGEIS